MLHIILLLLSAFLFTMPQDDVLDKETCSACYHSIQFPLGSSFCTAHATYRLKLKTVYYSQVRTALRVGE